MCQLALCCHMLSPLALRCFLFALVVIFFFIHSSSIYNWSITFVFSHTLTRVGRHTIFDVWSVLPGGQFFCCPGVNAMRYLRCYCFQFIVIWLYPVPVDQYHCFPLIYCFVILFCTCELSWRCSSILLPAAGLPLSHLGVAQWTVQLRTLPSIYGLTHVNIC